MHKSDFRPHCSGTPSEVPAHPCCPARPGRRFQTAGSRPDRTSSKSPSRSAGFRYRQYFQPYNFSLFKEQFSYSQRRRILFLCLPFAFGSWRRQTLRISLFLFYWPAIRVAITLYRCSDSSGSSFSSRSVELISLETPSPLRSILPTSRFLISAIPIYFER